LIPSSRKEPKTQAGRGGGGADEGGGVATPGAERGRGLARTGQRREPASAERRAVVALSVRLQTWIGRVG